MPGKRVDLHWGVLLLAPYFSCCSANTTDIAHENRTWPRARLRMRDGDRR